MLRERRISVIGVGNQLMGDDGVGVRIAEELCDQWPDTPAVEVVCGGVAGMALMPAVLDADDIVFVDALAVDAEPGAIFRFDPDEAGITGLRSTTSHGMGIPYLITNARMQGHFPSFLVYAVQIGDIMAGPDTLSPRVEAAVPRVASMIAEDVARMRLSPDVAALLR
jgi:hydrogenase maturation protease